MNNAAAWRLRARQDHVPIRGRRLRLVLLSFVAVAVVAFQFATYVPGLYYNDPFETAGLVVDCAATHV